MSTNMQMIIMNAKLNQSIQNLATKITHPNLDIGLR